MLTHLEIDGFKSLDGLKLDVAPFMVVIGANGVGKSNLFDGLQLMSHLASAPDLKSAFTGLRGEPEELFRRNADGSPGTKMRLRADFLLPLSVTDPYKDEVKVEHTRVSYEIVIALRRDEGRETSRLVVEHEQALPIKSREDPWKPYGNKPSESFRKMFCKYGRQRPFISMETNLSRRQFIIHQDGHGGRKREMPAMAAEATALSSITTAQFPTLFALKQELQSWRFLQLDPMGLRQPAGISDPEALLPHGRNLARVLARMKAETASELRPNGVLNDISADLVKFVSGIKNLSVEYDQAQRQYRVQVNFGDAKNDASFSARVLSDGTLRLLALMTLLHDPDVRGLVCFEEPENGIYPHRLGALIHRLRGLVCDPFSKGAIDEMSLRQVLLNSHSPVVLSTLLDERRSGEAFWADIVTVASAGSGPSVKKTRLRPINRTDETRVDFIADTSPHVTDGEVRSFLNTVKSQG